MQGYDLDKYINNLSLVDEKINHFIKKGILKKQDKDFNEISGHLLKSEHNLNFVNDNIKLNYLDWAIYRMLLCIIS